jgi:hypothetical protein
MEATTQYSFSVRKGKYSMARRVKPLVTKNGRVINGVYYGCPENSGDEISGLPSIPPERVGLNGEYDHYGLAKRVQASLHYYFGPDVTTRLLIQQRGSAILISGKVTNRSMAERLAQYILDIDGTTQVELHQLQIIEAQPDLAMSAALASAQV